jgi:hypothetical protein
MLSALNSAKLSAQSPPCSRNASPSAALASCFFSLRASPAKTSGGYLASCASTAAARPHRDSRASGPRERPPCRLLPLGHRSPSPQAIQASLIGEASFPPCKPRANRPFRRVCRIRTLAAGPPLRPAQTCFRAPSSGGHESPDRRGRGQPGTKPRRFVFVLLDNFTMLCFACAIEPLRIANRMSGKRSIPGCWRAKAATASPARTARLQARHGPRGGRPRRHDPRLRRHRRGARPHQARRELAAARGAARGGHRRALHGELHAGQGRASRRRKATIHWENQDGFAEEFEEVKLTKSVFVVDGNR